METETHRGSQVSLGSLREVFVDKHRLSAVAYRGMSPNKIQAAL